MKWTPDDVIRLTALIIVGIFVDGYIIGMFAKNHPTDENNKDLRMAIVLLIGVMVNNILSNKNKNDKL